MNDPVREDRDGEIERDREGPDTGAQERPAPPEDRRIVGLAARLIVRQAVGTHLLGPHRQCPEIAAVAGAKQGHHPESRPQEQHGHQAPIELHRPSPPYPPRIGAPLFVQYRDPAHGLILLHSEMLRRPPGTTPAPTPSSVPTHLPKPRLLC